LHRRRLDRGEHAIGLPYIAITTRR
jgi:hypothetical protein